MIRLGPVSWCVLAAILFGVSAPVCKLLLGGDIGPVALASMLYLGAGLCTLPIAIRHPNRRITRRTGLRLMGAIVFGGVLFDMGY